MTRFSLIVILVLSPLLPALGQADHGFRFVRVKYDAPSHGWAGAPWAHDHPTAELNFYEALSRTTRIHVEGPPLVLKLDNDRIFEYPVLYLCEPGYWTMSDEEMENLRQYLLRGGFILFDDFRGRSEWKRFEHQIARLFPEREPVELTPDHFIWQIYYDVDPVAAPSLVSGRGFQDYEDRYFALFDDSGRMMAMICFNQDIGDGWEWPERNLHDASLTTFKMGVNFLMYALTH